MGLLRSLQRILAITLLFLTGYCVVNADTLLSSRKYTYGQPLSDFEIIQRDEFCENNEHGTPQCSRLNENHLKLYCSVFATIAWGGAVRTVIKTFDLSIPYTVVLLVTGCIIGLGSRINLGFCTVWTQYTMFARTPPDLILFIFLPVLIFESAFNMKSHVFMSNIVSISTVALPGMLISVLVTALGTQQFLTKYEWTLSQAGLFGAIISATDPVAVVAILHELGTSENLSVMIEGESLLNDGVAILIYEILKEVVEEPDNENAGSFSHVVKTFVQIAIGGPIFGWLMGKVAIFSLTLIFNDAATEITITLVAAYFTYFVGEFYLKVSGVMAVVMLGVTINAGSTAISPEVQHAMQLFWEMMSFLGNTLLFVILGIVITETAINSFETIDGYYLLALYVFLTVTRFLMLLLLSLILHKIGYDTSFGNLLVMTWGGLRGAVGVCLSLQVFKSKALCHQTNVGPKILLQTAGIVILTLGFNGTTTKALLDYLGITALSVGKLHDMAHAVRNITAARVRTIINLQHDRFLYDANWDIVNKFTHIKDPYVKRQPAVKKDEESEMTSKISLSMKESDATMGSATAIATEEKAEKKEATPAKATEPEKKDDAGDEPLLPGVEDSTEMLASKLQKQLDQESLDIPEDNEPPNTAEFNKLMEESRIRVLKSMKISCWTQYEKGSLSEIAVKILVNALEKKEDEHLQMIHVSALKTHWQVLGFPAWMHKKVEAMTEKEKFPPRPKAMWRYPFYWLTTRSWFYLAIYVIVFLNLADIIYDLYLAFEENYPPIGSPQETYLYVCVLLFPSIYLLEFILKIIGLGVNSYCGSRWNLLDFLVLVFALTEMIMAIFIHNGHLEFQDAATFTVLKVFRICRLIRLLRWATPIIPLMTRIVDSRVNMRIFRGYGVASGYFNSLEDAIRLLPTIISHKEIFRKFRNLLDAERMETAKELLLLQMNYPGVCVAVKTRYASRSISGYMKEELEIMKLEGLLEENEYELLNSKIDGNLKSIWASPIKLKTISTETLIDNVAWGAGHNRDILAYFHAKALPKTFPKDTVIYKIGAPQNGIHLIVSGLVKLMYEPRQSLIERLMKEGIFPNAEVFMDLSYTQTQGDYIGIGGVIGEYGSLTKLPRSASVTCESEVEVIHWSKDVMDYALEHFDDPLDSLRARLWRSWGVKIASEFLHCTSQFGSWSGDKIRAHLEQGVVPVGSTFNDGIEIPEEYIQETILLSGVITNSDGEKLVAPALVPETQAWKTIKMTSGGDLGTPRVMLIPHEEDLESLDDLPEQTHLEKVILNAPGVYMSLKESEREHYFLLGKKMRKRSMSQSLMGVRPSAADLRKRRGSHHPLTDPKSATGTAGKRAGRHQSFAFTGGHRRTSH